MQTEVPVLETQDRVGEQMDLQAGWEHAGRQSFEAAQKTYPRAQWVLATRTREQGDVGSTR